MAEGGWNIVAADLIADIEMTIEELEKEIAALRAKKAELEGQA